MRNLSHWHHVSGPEYTDAHGSPRRSFYSYPVYDDELTPCEIELKRQARMQRQLEAQAEIEDQLIALERQRVELAKLISPQKPVAAISNRRGRWD